MGQPWCMVPRDQLVVLHCGPGKATAQIGTLLFHALKRMDVILLDLYSAMDCPYLLFCGTNTRLLFICHQKPLRAKEGHSAL